MMHGELQVADPRRRDSSCSGAWLTGLTCMVVLLLVAVSSTPSSAETPREFVGPVLAYATSDGEAVAIDDFGNGSSNRHPLRGWPSWSPDGRQVLATDPDSGQARVLDPRTGAVRHVLVTPQHRGSPFTAAWLGTEEIAYARGTRLVARPADGQGVERLILDTGDLEIFSITPSPDGRFAVLDGCILNDGGCGASVWSLVSGQELSGLGEGVGWGWSPDSRKLAFSGLGQRLNVLDVLELTTSVVYEATDQADSVGSMVFAPDGISLTVSIGYGTVAEVQTNTCCGATPLAVGVTGAPRSWSPDANLLAVQTESGLVVSRLGQGPIPVPGGEGSAGAFAPSTPSAPDDVITPTGVTRLHGPTRIQTAVATSQHRWPGGSATDAVLVRADDFADALSATVLARSLDSPLLLTYGHGLHSDTAAELERALQPDGTVWLVGGSAVLSGQVRGDIADLGFETRRLAGADRAATAIEVARASRAGETPSEVLIVEGGTFPDGLVAGNAAARAGLPLLVGQKGASFAESTWPDARLVRIGVWDAGVDVHEVIQGVDRYALAAAVAGRYPPDAGYALASGEAFPDGLAGGAHASVLGRALLLTHPEVLPSPVRSVLESSQETTIVVYGGTHAVSDSVAAQAVAL